MYKTKQKQNKQNQNKASCDTQKDSITKLAK